MNIEIYEDYSDEGIALARQLFAEYAQSLGFPLDFQDFNTELTELPGEYSPPFGRLLLGMYEDGPVGCIALRKIDEKICELKRMYIKPKFRRKGMGKVMAQEIIKRAKKIGYKKMRLDTLKTMKTALNIYKTLDFKEILPYRFNPLKDAVYLELEL